MKHYQSRSSQADQLAALVAEQLASALTSHEKAVLIVAGGSTPKMFMNSLSKTSIDWARVTVIPSDERWVENTHPRSNDRFIRANLLINQAAAATVVTLYVENATPSVAVEELESELQSYKTYPAICVLGMGEDAHFASLFPGSVNLREALDPNANASVLVIEAPGARETRVSLTLSRILKSAAIHLLISGVGKLTTLEKATRSGETEEMPIRALLNNSSLEIHYAE